MKIPEEVLSAAESLIAGRLGLDFRNSRGTDLVRGVSRYLQSPEVGDPRRHLRWLTAEPDNSPEWGRVAGYLTVGETYFFRDRSCFATLELHILPSLITARRMEGNLRLRLWSAGCSTGEEPYSLAIMLDRLLPDLSHWTVTILATDITEKSLETAQQGRYREWSFREKEWASHETPKQVRDVYFRQDGDRMFVLDPRIRGMVTFAPLNLAQDWYAQGMINTSDMDVIMCRNVLMYLSAEVQRAAVERLQRALARGGWLTVSGAEASAEHFQPLVPVNFHRAIFFRSAAETSAVAPPVAGSQRESTLSEFTAPAETQKPTPTMKPEGDFTVPVHIPPTAAAEPPEKDSEAQLEAPIILQRVRALADQGLLEESRRLCEGGLAQDRLNFELHLLLAEIHQERGETQEAVLVLRRAIYLEPNSAQAHFLLGTLFLRQGDYPAAARCMEAVTRLLSSVPSDAVVPSSDGVTAGRLLQTAQSYLTARGRPKAKHNRRTRQAPMSS